MPVLRTVARARTAPNRHPPKREVRVGRIARIDRDRPCRVGVPEVILGEGKTVDQVASILRELHRVGLGAIVSRASLAQLRAVDEWVAKGLPLRVRAEGRIIRLEGPLGTEYRSGVVGLLTAGTSDVPLAEEARAVLEELGVEVTTAYDVGVAGLHRLLRALRRIEGKRPEIYLVFAGREGALPTVVAGLVHAPVVGVPTSTGYGRGGRGEGALTAMLQSCAPLAVVNIDAAVPAALFVAQHFARRPPTTRRTPRAIRKG
ncbi:MAG: nickel pincer cofactor biosynthesis protein LarB [Thermoplasmata archaeon]|nr:nickel pincer cofactor biosynthesis protein LarB [Thermoplasmata archaeon]